MSELVKEQLVESHESLDRLERAVVAPTPEAVVPPSATPAKITNRPVEPGTGSSVVSDHIIRLDVAQLDELINLVSERSRKAAELEKIVTPANK